MTKKRIIFDMETGDPDDALTLALLCGHPGVNLVAVTVTPGTPHQIGVVRHILQHLGKDIPVGAFNLAHADGQDKNCVSPWHYKTFGDIPPSQDAEEGWKVLYAHWHGDVTLVTGGPLKNVGAVLANGNKEDRRRGIRSMNGHFYGNLVIQGGFAGDNIVPEADRLPKFQGRITCPTWNLNGDPESALRTFEYSHSFRSIHLVSKNVCHGVIYDQEMHEVVKRAMWATPEMPPEVDAERPLPVPHLKFIYDAMEGYLRKRPKGKKFHDPLAACCAINPDIGRWAEVEMYRERGEWGAKPKPGSDVQIITGYDHELFLKTLCGS